MEFAMGLRYDFSHHYFLCRGQPAEPAVLQVPVSQKVQERRIQEETAYYYHGCNHHHLRRHPRFSDEQIVTEFHLDGVFAVGELCLAFGSYPDFIVITRKRRSNQECFSYLHPIIGCQFPCHHLPNHSDTQ